MPRLETLLSALRWWLVGREVGWGGQWPAVVAVGVVVPNVLLGGGCGDPEAVVVESLCLLPERDGVLHAVPKPAGAALPDGETVPTRGMPDLGD